MYLFHDLGQEKFFNFVPFSHLINFVRQRRKTTKNVGSGTQTIAPIKQTKKVWVLLVQYFKKKKN